MAKIVRCSIEYHALKNRFFDWLEANEDSDLMLNLSEYASLIEGVDLIG